LDEESSKEMEDAETLALRKLRELGFPITYEDEDFIEQRVFLKDFGSPKESEFHKKFYDPYEQDLFNFPDSFKKYGENYDKYEEVKRFFDENPHAEASTPNRENEIPKDQKSWTRRY
jgi:hypothetical protein